MSIYFFTIFVRLLYNLVESWQPRLSQPTFLTFLTYLIYLTFPTYLTYLSYLIYLTYLTYLTYLPYLPNLFKTLGTKGVFPSLVRWDRCASTTDACPSLAALVSQY